MLAGKILQGGKYTLIQEIGRGGFGITFKAIHHYLNQEVVVKTMNEKLRRHPDLAKFQRQFQDEARRLATCIHPNIVRVSDFFVEDDLPYMVMEYIPGDTLGDAFVLPCIPVREDRAIHYIHQIGAALQVVHKNGLLHRDVKPDNIILRHGSQEVVLIDFGIAREFNNGARQTQTGIVSEGYSPMEQYLTQATRSPAMDVYGLAATLYALLTAHVPLSALLRTRQNMPSPRELQPSVSGVVSQAVMRGMAMEAELRPATVEEWLQLLPEDSVITPAVTTTSKTATLVLPVRGRKFISTSGERVVTKEPSELFGKTFLALGVAVFSAVAGFGITSQFSESQPELSPLPLFEQPISERNVKEPEITPEANGTKIPFKSSVKPVYRPAPTKPTEPSVDIPLVRGDDESNESSDSYNNTANSEQSVSSSPVQPTPKPEPAVSSPLLEKLRKISSSRETEAQSEHNSEVEKSIPKGSENLSPSVTVPTLTPPPVLVPGEEN